MRLAVNKLSGLRALRQARSVQGRLTGERVDLFVPDAAPQVRWTTKLLPLDTLALDAAPDAKRPLRVAVPDAKARLQADFAASTVYSQGLPAESFIELEDGIAVSCPELAFVEAGTYMTPLAHILLGFELCGTYVRDARDARCGNVAFGVEPATSVARIRAYIETAGHVRGSQRAKELLAYVADNAWSPMEAVVAALAAIPTSEGGYGLGQVLLNVRRPNSAVLVSLGCKESRVPDIQVAGTRVGFNYDGREHFELSEDNVASRVADAQPRLDRNSREDHGSTAEPSAASGRKSPNVAAMRAKYLDDLRRNRELAASGAVVLPVTSEDLFQQGGLDTVMLEAVLLMEQSGELKPAKARELKAAIRMPALRRERQRIIWSLLPWDPGDAHARQITLSLIHI